MKKILPTAIASLLVFTLLLLACEEKGGRGKTSGDLDKLPPKMSNTHDLKIALPPQDTVFDDDLWVEIDYLNSSGAESKQQAISLSYFITTAGISYPKLYAFRPAELNAEGISIYDPWNRPTPLIDLLWSDFAKGYLVPSQNYRTFFYDYTKNMINGYNVQRVNAIFLFRTIVVVNPQSKPFLFELNLLPTQERLNTNGVLEPSYLLTDLITKFITENPQQYEYLYETEDEWEGTTFEGKTNTFSWVHMQNGYYLKESDRIFIPDYNTNGAMRPSRVVKISLIGASIDSTRLLKN